MNWAAAQKRMEASQRREERDVRKRQKEIEQKLKEYSKQSLQEQARLEVESYENSLEVLLSVQRDSSQIFDWMALVTTLPSHKRADQDQMTYDQEYAEWEKMRSVAKQVLAGDAEAYGEALAEMSAFGELSTLGSSITFRVENAKLIECELHVSGRDVIPKDVKSLTSTGKVTSKAMPKGRFHELYQDYVCGCVLRVAREVFALLPVDVTIVTALVPSTQASTGKDVDIPVLSVAMSREVINRLDFQRLDPSDSMENFVHQGNVMVSKQSGEFTAITPLSSKDITVADQSRRSFEQTLDQVLKMRADLAGQLKKPLAEDTHTLAPFLQTE